MPWAEKVREGRDATDCVHLTFSKKNQERKTILEGQLSLSVLIAAMQMQELLLMAKHRFVVLSTWKLLSSELSPKGFGAFESLKERIGAPTSGPVLGKEDPQMIVKVKR